MKFSPRAYQYPDDTAMLERLAGLRILQDVVARFIREIGEPWVSGELTGTGVRVSPRQFPELYAVAASLADLFGLPVPHLFLIHDARLNAFTHGIGNQSFVAITTPLFEQLDEPGLRFILGHEFGHIHCRHVLYTTMLHWLLENGQNGMSQDVILQMLNGMRLAEISADRAGLLACGDAQVAARAALTLVTGTAKLAARIDIDEYISEQCLSLEYNPIALRRQDIHSHPYMPFRLCELMKFSASLPYRQAIDALREPDIELNDDALAIRLSEPGSGGIA
ncbi:MAG: M48 family metallopeptidase [Armatimonadota bacterium]